MDFVEYLRGCSTNSKFCGVRRNYPPLPLSSGKYTVRSISFRPSSPQSRRPSSEVAFLTAWLNTTAAWPPDWSSAASSPCHWSHVSCAGNGGTVTSVSFQSVHLAATVPAGLCDALPGLESFVVSDANLTGGVPDDLWQCRRLAMLDVSSNALTSPVPPSLGNAMALATLALNSNQLSGPIPPELASLAPTLRTRAGNGGRRERAGGRFFSALEGTGSERAGGSPRARPGRGDATASTSSGREKAGGARRKNAGGEIFYSPDMRVLCVIEMLEDLELYQTLFGNLDLPWSCSMVELRGSAALELFFSEPELYQTGPK